MMVYTNVKKIKKLMEYSVLDQEMALKLDIHMFRNYGFHYHNEFVLAGNFTFDKVFTNH